MSEAKKNEFIKYLQNPTTQQNENITNKPLARYSADNPPFSIGAGNKVIEHYSPDGTTNVIYTGSSFGFK